MRRFLKQAVGFSTAYSGAGFFESIVFQLCRHCGLKPPPCTHGWEIVPKCRQALLARNVSDGPEHVFGDLMSIFPQNKIRKLKRVQRVLLKEHKQMLKAGAWSHVSGVLSKGLQLMQACDGLLSAQAPADTAYCYRHGRHCTIPRVGDGLHFHAAGTTCVDYSRRSTSQLRLNQVRK